MPGIASSLWCNERNLLLNSLQMTFGALYYADLIGSEVFVLFIFFSKLKAFTQTLMSYLFSYLIQILSSSFSYLFSIRF